MNNLKQTGIFARVAERMGKDEELIKFVINHMWSEIRANVIRPKTWKLQVNNFGIFSPKEKKIEHFVAAVKAKGSESRLRKEKLDEFERILTLKNKQKQ